MSDIRKRTGKKGATYQVRYPSKAAETGYAYRTFNTLKEARAFLESGRALAAGQSRRVEISAVSEAVERWLQICEKIGRDGREKVEPATLTEYRRRAGVMREYRWERSLQELEPADVVQFRNWLLENKSRDLARRTLSSFHSVMIEMIHQGQLTHDPAAGISIKTGGRYEDDASLVEIPTDREMRAIFAAADALYEKGERFEKSWSRYRPMIYLAGFTGMRPSEYRGLRWSDVHADHVTVTQRADIKGRMGPVKSRAGRRKIFLPDVVSEMLAEWREQCPPSDLGLVFPTATGRPQSLNRFRRSAWVPLMREAGLMETVKKGGKTEEKTRYTIYSLRHYFASKLIEKNFDLKYIQETMGHAQIETTLNIYGHLLRDKQKSRKQRADRLAAELLGI